MYESAFFPSIDVPARMAEGLEYRLEFVVLVAVGYLVSVWMMKKFIELRGKPYDLKPVSHEALSAWNFFLAAASAYLFVWMIQTVMYSYEQLADGVWELTCNYKDTLQNAPFMAPLHVIFITKYLELVDTAFLCLRGKPTPFIHVYHHAITIYFTWMHMMAGTCIIWQMAIMNLGVHVLLYTYYALAALGVEIWFKRYLTIIQIAQFVATLVPSITVLSSRILWTINPEWGYPCHGSWFSAIIGSCILISYLYLFLRLYLTRFDATGADRKKLATASPTNLGEILLKPSPGTGRIRQSSVTSPLGVHPETEYFDTISPHAAIGISNVTTTLHHRLGAHGGS